MSGIRLMKTVNLWSARHEIRPVRRNGCHCLPIRHDVLDQCAVPDRSDGAAVMQALLSAMSIAIVLIILGKVFR